jgi:hypothetical protein
VPVIGNFAHSTLITVNTRDNIKGSMTLLGCGRTCNYAITTTDTSKNPPQSTTLNTAASALSWAYIVLEVWYWTKCTDYPATGLTVFSSLSLTDVHGTVTPSWSGTVIQNNGCGEKVQINSPSLVSLWY